MAPRAVPSPAEVAAVVPTSPAVAATAPITETRQRVATPQMRPCDRQPPTEAEVARWVEDYRRALESKDFAKLAELGEAASPKRAQALHAKLDGIRGYEVRIENVNVETSGGGARLVFDLAERWKDPDNPAFVLDFNHETKVLERRDCRLVSSARD